MKSILITILMFALASLAVYFHLFEIMSSPYAYGIAFIFVMIALGFALKVLGLPSKDKDGKHDER